MSLDFFRKHTQGKVAKILLGLISVPFALWGIDSYVRNGGQDAHVAEVNGEFITQQEFQNVYKQEQNRLRQMLGGNAPATLESMELKREVLSRLIDEKLLIQEAKKQGITVSNQQVANFIGQIPVFQDNGQFSQQRYESVLKQQGFTPVQFEALVRQDLMTNPIKMALLDTRQMSKAQLDLLIRLNDEQRELSFSPVTLERFLNKVQPTEQDLKTYYDKHQKEYAVPHQVKLEYVVLSAEELTKQIQISEADLKKYYEETKEKYKGEEERQASHILITKETPNAKAEAERILAEVKKDPKRFPELAKKYSKDPGSAEHGGDLGYFSHGMMVKAFDEAVFSMKPQEIRGPIETEFGYHIIYLTNIKQSTQMGFDKIKDQLQKELMLKKANEQFSKLAEEFNNLAYEQAASLKPVADKFKLHIAQSDWMSQKTPLPGILGNKKLLDAVFTDDVLKNKRNTPAIEVGPNTLIAARVLEQQVARQRSLTDVKAEVTKLVQTELAQKQAVTYAKDVIARLEKNEQVADLQWNEPQGFSRQRMMVTGFNDKTAKSVFQIPPRKMPAYLIGESPAGGVTLVKVNKVLPLGEIKDDKRQFYQMQFRQFLAQSSWEIYLKTIRQKATIKVTLNQEEKK